MLSFMQNINSSQANTNVSGVDVPTTYVFVSDKTTAVWKLNEINYL